MGFQIKNIKNLFKRKQPMNSQAGIHSTETFRLILDRERSRAERTGHIFSLVIFGFNHGKDNDASLLEHLGAVLVQKVRVSDEVGWYEEKNSIGALLPGTSAEGAWQFIDIIKKKIEDTESSLIYTVYTYPFSSNAFENHEKNDENEEPRSQRIVSSCRINKSHAATPYIGNSAEPVEILLVRPIPLWKRGIDFFGALLLLVILSPLLLIIAILIKIVSPGPVFYRQQRIGYRGKPFIFWKFRTMHVNNNAEIHRKYLSYLIETDAPMRKLDEDRDNRIIPFGKFLRYTCLDELPQLFNVLLGDMSLVGPRPCLPYEAKEYLKWHTRRFDIVPGMTGLWQVSGKNRTTFKEMIRLDIRYSRRMSPGLDTKILLLTWPAIIGMVSEPLSRKMARGQESSSISPSRREQSVRG